MKRATNFCDNLLAPTLLLLLLGASTGHAFLVHYQQQQRPVSQQQQQQQQQPAAQTQAPTQVGFNPSLAGQHSSASNGQASTGDHAISAPGGKAGRDEALAPGASEDEPPLAHLRPSSQSMESRDAGPVFRYHGIALNSTTVKLFWNLLSGFHADLFEIKYGPIPDATEVYSLSLNGSSRDITINQLQPDTLYQFRLQGFSGEHAYRPQLVPVKTLAANYVSKSLTDFINKELTPLGVKAEPKSNQSIQLSWSEPDKPANIKHSARVNIIRYYVNPSALLAAQSNSSANDSSSSVASQQQQQQQQQQQIQYHYLNVTNARESRLIVQRLKPATEYAFAIKTAYYTPDMKRIFTQSGFSMDTIAKTFDLEPSPPKNFNVLAQKDEGQEGQNVKLELSWSPPDSPNGQLRGYVILFSYDSKVPDDTWTRIHVNDSSINNWYITNLKAGASHYFKMRAINQRGQSGDTETRLYIAPAPLVPLDKIINAGPIPANNLLMLIVIFLVAILFVLFLVVSRLFCRTRRKPRHKTSALKQNGAASSVPNDGLSGAPKLNGHLANNASVASTVAARVGTLARPNRRNQAAAAAAAGDEPSGKPDFWISAMEQQQEVKSNISEKSNSELNMAMVSIRRDSPQFSTQTQLAPSLPEYRFGNQNNQLIAEQQMMQRLQQQQSHYHAGHQFAMPTGPLAFDQMDNATASGLMTLSKRQHQQLQKYQMQFANNIVSGPLASTQTGAQAPSPHQQPPPPPPLNIEQQNQPLYGTNQALNNTRSLRLNRQMYNPVTGDFSQTSEVDPPNYNSLLSGPLLNSGQPMSSLINTSGASTLQFHHPHQSSTLLSRRSTNTLRSFQSGAAGIYGQLGGANQFLSSVIQPPSSMASNPPLLQNHQAVINQLNNSAYPSLAQRQISAARPQIMSNLEDQIEMELAEKAEQQQQQQHQQQQQQVQS